MVNLSQSSWVGVMWLWIPKNVPLANEHSECNLMKVVAMALVLCSSLGFLFQSKWQY